MSKRVVPFRRIRHGDPKKMKVLAEDIRPARRTVFPFALLVAAVMVVAFSASFLLA